MSNLSYHFYIFVLESLPTVRSGNNRPTRSLLYVRKFLVNNVGKVIHVVYVVYSVLVSFSR